MKMNISPEEKLLRLIRGHKKGSKEQGQGPGGLAGLGTGGVLKPSFAKSGNDNFNLLLAKRIIAVCFILAFLYLIIAYVYPLTGLKNAGLPQITPEESPETEPREELQIQPFEYYSQGIQGREIFSSPATQPQGKNIEAKNVDLDLTRDLKLLGIIAGDNPQAIIEDAKNQKTYYLNKNQSIGDFQVEDIQEGKVILNNQGQKFELYL